ncbi:MAG: O-antigen ligase family protein [Bacteroidota bacterium]
MNSSSEYDMAASAPVTNPMINHETAAIRWIRMTMMAGMYLFLASTYFSIAVNSISLGLMAITWLLLMTLRRQWSVSPTPLDSFFLAYLIVQAVSTAFSVDPAHSLHNSKRILLIGLVYFFATVLADRSQLKRAFVVLHGSATLVALIGVAKLLFGNPEETVRLGVFQFYMTTSGLMLIASLLALPFVIHRCTPGPVRWAMAMSLMPILVVLYATVTRGAYLAFVGGAVFIAIMRNRKLILPIVLVMFLAALFAPPYIQGRIQSIVDLSHPENVTRLTMWISGLRIFADYPLVGVGDIDLGELMRHYADPGYLGVWGHMHNVPLQFLVTHGILGAAVVAAMLFMIAKTEWRIYRRVRAEWFEGSLALGALAVFLGVLLHGLTEWSLGDQEIAVLVWTTLGLSLAVDNLSYLSETTMSGHEEKD